MSHKGFAIFGSVFAALFPGLRCFFNKSVSAGFEFNSGSSARLQKHAVSPAKFSLTCSSVLAAVHLSLCVNYVLLFLHGLPCAPLSFLPAWIIQTDVDFPQCPSIGPVPPLTSTNLNHACDSRKYHLLQTSTSGPLPAPPPIPPLYPFCIWSLSRIQKQQQQGFNSPSSFIVFIYQCRNQGCGGG